MQEILDVKKQLADGNQLGNSASASANNSLRAVGRTPRANGVQSTEHVASAPRQ